MVLLGFTTRRDEILLGVKTCTTRLARKTLIKEGEKLYLYWGLRTRECRKLGEATCLRVTRLTWANLQRHIESSVGYRRMEGNFTAEELTNWFETHYKPMPLTLFDIVEWRGFTRDPRWVLVKSGPQRSVEGILWKGEENKQ